MASPMVTIPADELRELAKWAYAAAHFESLVPVDALTSLPSVGRYVREIAKANEERERSDWSEPFEQLQTE